MSDTGLPQNGESMHLYPRTRLYLHPTHDREIGLARARSPKVQAGTRVQDLDAARELRKRVPNGLIGEGSIGRWLNMARLALVRRDGDRCRGCEFDGRPFVDDWFWDHSSFPFPFEVDHVVALCDGGEHALTNMQLLCERCHRAKTIAERRARSAGKKVIACP